MRRCGKEQPDHLHRERRRQIGDGKIGRNRAQLHEPRRAAPLDGLGGFAFGAGLDLPLRRLPGDLQQGRRGREAAGGALAMSQHPAMRQRIHPDRMRAFVRRLPQGQHQREQRSRERREHEEAGGKPERAEPVERHGPVLR